AKDPTQDPIDEPRQPEPAWQPLASPSPGNGLTGHDMGGGGVAGIVPDQTGFQPTPGSTSHEHSAKRVSDGVPGLPSTSPD
ncbi:MAG: hypothetical protein JOZ47_09580, partial [Kutzneria sp.]|nr:hypothetical protein [Kutzneria sp.]